MSDTLYQITQTAAQVCSVLPLPAPGLAERLDRWADHWQSLLGSVVGGIGGGVLGLLAVPVQLGVFERFAATRVWPASDKSVGHLKCFRFRIIGYFDAFPKDFPVGSRLRPSVLLIAPGRYPA